MSYYNFNTPEEDARKNNISQFLDGLLEENATSESNAGNPSTTFLKPEGRKADVGKKQDLKRSKITLAAGQKRKRVFCECKFAQRRFLPESELRAFKHHSDLLKENEKNILKIPFSIHNIKHSDTLVHIYTGIPEARGFFHLAAMFRKEHISYYLGWIVGQLTIKQQLLMTLMKLRLGLTDIHLSHRYVKNN
ncbi:uncharacterized protein LOC112127556 [Cimex lectularius]|uniref:Transposase Helix-turn-helix domain-containing protein n=1 Tax=Cimex lectularius TaxID=79782 RepID=A0A8I6SQN4_CIMLE|nr:uncharacterized protein LOC112127556 [Cimex lectularius]